MAEKIEIPGHYTYTGTSGIDRVDTYELNKSYPNNDGFVILGESGDDDISSGIYGFDRTKPSTHKSDYIDAGDGSDFISASAYMTNNASVVVSGGKGTDSLYLTTSKLTSNPIFSREKLNEASYTKFTVADKDDGSPLTVTVLDDVEILTFNDSLNNSIYFLTEDIANGRIRRVDGEEMVWRTVGSNSDWAANKLDTYTPYQQFKKSNNLPVLEKIEIPRHYTYTGTSGIDRIRTYELNKSYPNNDGFVILGESGDDDISSGIIGFDRTKSSTHKSDFIDAGDGDDYISAYAYMTNNASVVVSGGKGADTLYFTGSKLTSNPIFSREKLNEVSYTKFTVVDEDDGSPLTVTAFDDVEILTFNDSSNNSIYFLTEDLANGRIRRVDREEMVWRTYGTNSDWADNKLDTYTAYQQYKNPVNLPTYNIATSSSLNEGETINVDISTTSVAPGTNLYYSLSGVGISFNDFSSGFLSDTLYDFGTVGTDGKLSLRYTIENDFSTEGTESLEIKLFSTTSPVEKLSSGVERSYLIDVSGVPTKFGDTIYVRYLGKLFNGTVFDQNIFDRKKSQFSFQLGAGSVIKGWDIGLLGVNVGDVLILSIPADQAYGKNAVGSIPANSPLKFAVQVLGRTDARGSEKVTDTTPDLSLSASKQVGATVTVAIKDTSTQLVSIEKQGSIELLADASNNAMVKSSAGSFQLKRSGWGDLKQDRGGWKITAAETINSKNYVLDRSDGMVFVWEMDNNWNFLRDSQSASPGQAEFYQLETNFGIDLNRDGVTGIPSNTKSALMMF